ncbi:YdeI/OmpD-associated family protein [Chondromyces apiculatus]|nr:YdeI/OmpD-associated family protein [Chondromyces apiculatus]
MAATKKAATGGTRATGGGAKADAKAADTKAADTKAAGTKAAGIKAAGTKAAGTKAAAGKGGKGVSPGESAGELPILAFATLADWNAWLSKEHGRAPGAWLKFAKKGSGVTTVTYDEAVEGALCWGWIDGQKQTFDASYYLLRFTPRRRASVWSEINRGKVQALIASGKMQAPGLAEVERAKADGRWEAAYPSQSRATVPEDLAAALEASPEAKAFFATLNSVNRYAVIHRVFTAVKPETRARRIAQFVAMLTRGEKLHG